MLETKPRIGSGANLGGIADLRPGPPRFGFTITKKLGGAVERNRIRRRLKAAIASIAADLAKPGHDYVIVARQPALTQPFDVLKKELEDAFHRVHHPRRIKSRSDPHRNRS